ncbi:MAG: hypothetical protein A3H06_01375 [Candidatus Colwellbacteria bacterium RIFCSPLOWO2_12_FULL_44_13]|uniref:Uncharacterized protein n=3 Tax=Candidatus Colwelliibacteriota TaxID=1817904 RepID=A0A1G1Z8Q2_9BACT|nr:MAG: hypothetical protein A3F24_03215 [Candidatus Colwellbacteria bacterium RIFCSPHIGHO2_12_FULL_44_17]OGY60446.1 MAG: hypothetical protein A3I31_01110 [Candidatus Colwellbacteria bacterium RIFCSPLOWO2_02_FULL_44_20b]OGY61326.1 MAG: hypothetical protein A3H06_01375 [Candidatus Colwellbacteria bacterium RIFCSPLOWO2_12_FULL_44_13]
MDFLSMKRLAFTKSYGEVKEKPEAVWNTIKRTNASGLTAVVRLRIRRRIVAYSSVVVVVRFLRT